MNTRRLRRLVSDATANAFASLGGIMRFLLTSAGITNASIRGALVELLGRPIAECSALVIPTAAYYFSQGPARAYRLISGTARRPLADPVCKPLSLLRLPPPPRPHTT